MNRSKDCPPDELVPYVVRTEGKKNRGWQLRVPAWVEGGPKSYYFADNFYGGRKAALEAAIARKAYEIPAVHSAVTWVHRKNTRNKSGFIGVSYSTRPSGNRRTLHRYWEAYWSRNGVQQHRRFSIDKLGEAKAWALAMDVRIKEASLTLTDAEWSRAREQALAHLAELAAQERR